MNEVEYYRGACIRGLGRLGGGVGVVRLRGQAARRVQPRAARRLQRAQRAAGTE